MAKTFLRSGSLDAVLALGVNGQPVFLSALQLRETLRLRKQQQIADCLAIPQPNDAGDRLDWYAPVSGKVTSWAAADESVRSHALSQLEACQQAVAEICQRAERAEKPSQKLFGALLAKAIQFPDRNFVYLVGGKPVITFWGFVSLEKKHADALDSLRETLAVEPPLTLSKLAGPDEPLVPAPVPVTPAVAVVAAAAPVAAEAIPLAQPEPELQPATEHAKPVVSEPAVAAKPIKTALLRYGWALPAAALLITFGIQLKGCTPQEDATPSATQTSKPVAAPAAPVEKPAAPVETKPVEAEKTPVTPEVTPPADPVTAPVAALPVAPAQVAPVKEEATVAEPAAEEAKPAEAVPDKPVAADDLVMPSLSVKLGTTKFLDGKWRVIVHIKNSLTGKPPSLRYQFKNGKGVARMTQGNGSECRVTVYAGLMQSGNLVINSRTTAKCSDGSRYKLPELVCSQGASGPAECNGVYNADTVIPMTMKRESK
ncbi:SrfA family protein [Erwinia sp. P6884]|uniref:SrfA family protein n=1 Tax=Erwinia sp. P6884 TaxID=3141450 RepID=UPI00318A2314